MGDEKHIGSSQTGAEQTGSWTSPYGPDGNAVRPGAEPVSTEKPMPPTREEAVIEARALWEQIDAWDKADKEGTDKRVKARLRVSRIQQQFGIPNSEVV